MQAARSRQRVDVSQWFFSRSRYEFWIDPQASLAALALGYLRPRSCRTLIQSGGFWSTGLVAGAMLRGVVGGWSKEYSKG